LHEMPPFPWLKSFRDCARFCAHTVHFARFPALPARCSGSDERSAGLSQSRSAPPGMPGYTDRESAPTAYCTCAGTCTARMGRPSRVCTPSHAAGVTWIAPCVRSPFQTETSKRLSAAPPLQ